MGSDYRGRWRELDKEEEIGRDNSEEILKKMNVDVLTKCPYLLLNDTCLITEVVGNLQARSVRNILR